MKDILIFISQYSNQIGFVVSTITLAVLIWYTWETKKIREQTVLQTELATTPVMSLYIRRVIRVADKEKRETIKHDYTITHMVDNKIEPSTYFFALRNVGRGPAFNVQVESQNFKAVRYQMRFFSQGGEERAVKISKKSNDEIKSLDELKGEVFTVKYQSVSGKIYEHKYKVNSVEEKAVEFII